MIETTTLLLFLTASVLLTLAPGPDIIFLITRGITRGARAGISTALGLAAGNLVHTVAAVLGIAVLFRNSAVAFQVLKMAGVIYLLLLAWRVVRVELGRGGRQGSETSGPESQDEPGKPQAGSLFWRGFLMNILNPKVILFFLAFLPQFVNPQTGPVWIQMLLLGLLFTLQVVVLFGAVGLFAGQVNCWLKRGGGSGMESLFNWVSALIFLGLAARLFLVKQ